LEDPKIPVRTYKILNDEDLPEGAAESDEEKEANKVETADDLDVDIQTPLREDEIMPKIQAYARPEIGGKDQKKGEKEETKSSKKNKKDKHGKKRENR